MAQTHAALSDADNGHSDRMSGQHLWVLALAAVGVVYGDIGTSPLYAFREAVAAASGHGPPTRAAVLGVLSLILWSLTLIVTVKYVAVLLRADNNGEGGTFALMALAQSASRRNTHILFLLGVVGASFFFGDALLTPAISVLSAVEGLKLVAPALEKLGMAATATGPIGHALERVVLPATLLILVALFSVQSRGTASVARLFGPVMTLWFVVMALGGLAHIADDPGVFAAINPLYGLHFLAGSGMVGLATIGFVFLAVTGGEALYADLGHFGRRPIQAAWFWLVFPALVINYFGQGALVLAHPEAINSPFYKLFPDWALIPVILLATVATVIASQAVITGAFSIARQAIQLGYLPRFLVRHTSEEHAGQIYLPRLNWILLAGVLTIVVMFRSSSSLAAAYGVSVTATMVVDSLMLLFVVWQVWRRPLWQAIVMIAPLLAIEQVFFSANLIKVADGGWAPLLLGGGLGLVMLTWVRGSEILRRETRRAEADLDWLLRKLERKPPHRVSGTAVFLTANPDSVPTSLMHNLKHNRVLHERNIIMTIRSADQPRVPNSERAAIRKVSDGFTCVTLTYGFMETPNVPRAFALLRKRGLSIIPEQASFFLSRRVLRRSKRSPMPAWQDRLFMALAGTAEDATTYFQIPTDRVVEIGTQVEV